MQIFLGFSGYSSKAPSDTSMIVHFRKRCSDDDLRRINELVVRRGKEMLVEVVASLCDVDDSDDTDPGTSELLSMDNVIKPADWPEGKNWGTLMIDANCIPADIHWLSKSSADRIDQLAGSVNGRSRRQMDLPGPNSFLESLISLSMLSGLGC
jgi:hypothetical protein